MSVKKYLTEIFTEIFPEMMKLLFANSVFLLSNLFKVAIRQDTPLLVEGRFIKKQGIQPVEPERGQYRTRSIINLSRKEYRRES